MHEWACFHDETANHQFAQSCGLLNHPNSFYGGVLKLNTKCDADSWLYLLSHFECDGHTVHMLTQQHLPPPLTSSVKLSLLTHTHSRSLSFVARLHWCCANCSGYINSGYTVSRQTSYTILETRSWLISLNSGTWSEIESWGNKPSWNPRTRF